MAQRRSPHRVSSTTVSSPLERRKYPLRRSPTSRTRAACASISSPDLRPVLVPLHPNLRRLPSRLLLAQKDISMRDSCHSQFRVLAGSKRKRVASSNENAQNGGRPARGSGRPKRLRSASSRRRDYGSDEDSDGASSMEVDTPARWSVSDDSELEDEKIDEEAEENDDSTDDHLINTAQPHQLQRLRKDELVRLYTSAGLSSDAESLTKSEIIDAIVAARDDVADLPPSSPPGRGDGNSSEYSSDDGNVAGDEETDIGRPRYGPSGAGLKRRATYTDVGRVNGRRITGRSLSMGHLAKDASFDLKRKSSKFLGEDKNADVEGSGTSALRRRTSSRSSPSGSAVSASLPSPPATRLRSRKASASAEPSAPVSGSSSAVAKGAVYRGRGKVKQVEFSDEVQVQPKTPSKRSVKERGRERGQEKGREDGEAELEVHQEGLNTVNGQPSPRRLRSKDKQKAKESTPPRASVVAERGQRFRKGSRIKGECTPSDTRRRITPMRKAKGKIGCLREEDDDGVDDEEGVEEEGEEEIEEDELCEEDAGEEEEVDELVSSASATPPPSTEQRTPVKRRLRPRKAQMNSPPSDGDDEEEADEGEEQEEEQDDDVEEEEDDEEVVEDGSVDDEGDEATVVAEPRKLRNGKIVGEEDTEMITDDGGGDDDEDEAEEETEEEAEAEAEEEAEDEDEADEEAVEAEVDDGLDVDVEGETDEDEAMDDDVDLTVATAKTLVRLRRDDLVRLCETRDLEAVGTKPQLADVLLQWRDRQANDFSSPSSAGTACPPSTAKRRHRRWHSEDTATPVPMRSHHVHLDEPRTPPISENQKDTDPELELDLESLGLEDREIPPEKLQKLEKIGSGGFKDVFIGRFKGRKIAISEFRGQLSAMDIKELKLLGGFDHPNIVRFLGVSIPENTRETPVMIVSELCSNGDLFDYIRNVNPPSLHKILRMMLDVARGLEYLHLRKPSVIHRDCKSSNILITTKGTAKIADFGLAKVKQSTRSMVRSLVGTVNWQAPELWHAHPKYNHKVDVFSCAMVYWETLQWHLPNKKFPWEGMNEHAIYEIVGTKRQRPSLSGLRKQWCQEIVDLIERMWAHEHQDRPSMSEVVEILEELVGIR